MCLLMYNDKRFESHTIANPQCLGQYGHSAGIVTKFLSCDNINILHFTHCFINSTVLYCTMKSHATFNPSHLESVSVSAGALSIWQCKENDQNHAYFRIRPVFLLLI